MGSQENFALVEELAQLLGGVVGATPSCHRGGLGVPCPPGRPVRQDCLPPPCTSPAACPAPPSTCPGMTGSGYVVAINKDEDAPIFDVADVGIVGDVMKVLPAMIEEIRKRKAE